MSIVTISFNQADFLERTIRSVADQDYPNIEHIVVDPGSTDGSRDIISRYTTHFARILLEPDQGPADGLNKGFSVATGDILGFLNADDILYPSAISAVVEFFVRNPQCDVGSGHAKIIDPSDKVLRLVYSDRMSVLRCLYSSVVLIQPSTYFRRSAFERTRGFNTANQSTWDGELFFEMARAGCNFSRCDKIWTGFRLHRRSITASRRLEDVANAAKEQRFEAVTGRRRNKLDKGIEAAFRVWKHIANPRDTLERILKGPVYGRSPD